MDKIKTFEYELNLIKNEDIRKFVEEFLKQVPDYFFTTAASSTGNYHPQYALGKGGLVRHTKAATRIAYELFRVNFFKYSEIEQDIILASLILHDTYKHGLNDSKYTVTEHPTIAANKILNFESQLNSTYKQRIANNIASHMGQWNFDYKTKKRNFTFTKNRDAELRSYV